MSKKKSKSRISKKQRQKEPKTIKYSIILPLLLGICTILGGLAAVVIFLPRPMVSSPSIPVDKNNVSSVSFDISNGGYIPLEDCTALLGVGQIGTHLDPSFIPTFKNRLVMPAWQHHRLGMDERFTIVLSDALGNFKSADIAIIASYKPWFFPISREKIYRFVTLKQSNGQSYWRSWPLDEPLPYVP